MNEPPGGRTKKNHAFLSRQAWALYATIALLIAALTALWAFTPLSAFIKPERMTRLFEALRGEPWAPLAVLGIYAVSGLLFVPINALFLGTAVLFPMPWNLLLALTGGAMNAAIGWGIGKTLGERSLARWFSETYQALKTLLENARFWHILVARLLPVAPYTAGNLVGGALNIPFWRFTAASTSALLPGALAMMFVGKSVTAFLNDMSWEKGLLLAGAVACAIGAGAAATRWAARKAERRA